MLFLLAGLQTIIKDHFLALCKQCLPWDNSYAMVLSLIPKEEDRPRFKGLVPNVHNAYNMLYLALEFGIANIYQGLRYTLGVLTLSKWEKVAMIMCSLQTIGMWVLAFDNGRQAGAIDAPWILWQPKLRAWLTMEFGHFLCFVGYLVSDLRSG